MKKITIVDVAKRAGVSMKSVSRVVNNEPNVRATLRDRVNIAIKELGYKPSFAARALAAGRSFVIGVLFDNPSPHYTMKIQDGIYAACKSAGYQLVIEHVSSNRDEVAADIDRILINGRLDGLILTPPITDCEPALSAIEAHNVRYVRISPGAFPARSSSVGTNDEAAVDDMVNHLWDLGHRTFGLVNGPAIHAAAHWRRNGFLSALAKRGIAAAQVQEAAGEFTFQSGILAGLDLLKRDKVPTAIFATNDDMAAGIFAASAQLGVHIPSQLSVTGFDDSWIAESVWPSLTTIHQPIAEMAEAAAEILIAGRDGSSDPVMIHQACRFVLRQSTGPVGD